MIKIKIDKTTNTIDCDAKGKAYDVACETMTVSVMLLHLLTKSQLDEDFARDLLVKTIRSREVLQEYRELVDEYIEEEPEDA